jgi:hypothetical protein
MPEQAMSGKEHRNTKAICSIDNFLITNRSTWLNYCGSASSSGLFQTISEWEECITGKYTPYRTFTSSA